MNNNEVQGLRQPYYQEGARLGTKRDTSPPPSESDTLRGWAERYLQKDQQVQKHGFIFTTEADTHHQGRFEGVQLAVSAHRGGSHLRATDTGAPKLLPGAL